MSLVASIPSPILADFAGSGGGTYGHADLAYDYAIGGLPFIAAFDPNNKMVRKTAPYRKPYSDNSLEPGEHSLSFWWIKAQSSFHGGAGQIYIDTPVSQGAEVRPIRYNTSKGVDPWTQGKVSLLKSTSKAASVVSSTFCRMRCVTSGGNNYILYSDGTGLYMVQETVASGTPTYGAPVTVNWVGTGNIQSLVTDGTNYYVTDGTGIYRGVLATPATAAVKIYNMTAGTALLSWCKQRLMLGYTTSTTSAVYELNAAAGAGTALPAAKFSHPNIAWIWTAFAQGPNAIYASGYAGQSSAVYKFVLDSGGAVPTLTTGITVAEFSSGEVVSGMYGYLSTNLAITTNKGLRVATFAQGVSDGEFQYGPVTVPFTTAASVQGVTGIDRFLFAAYVNSDGIAGIARADLSQQLTVRPFSYTPDARYAWAPDLRATDATEAFVAGSTTDVDQIGGRVAFLVPGQGVFVEHPSVYTPTGSLTTSRIRYETLDLKLARFVRIRAEGLSGIIAAAVAADSDATGASNGQVTLPTGTDSGDMAVSVDPFQYTTVTFDLSRSATATTETPSLLGYQLKGLPAQKRQRYIQIPLLCFDFEQDSTGQEVGYEGRALERLLAVEELDALGDLVSFQALSPYTADSYTTLAVIEDCSFEQTTPPTDRSNWGGILTVTLRTVG